MHVDEITMSEVTGVSFTLSFCEFCRSRKKIQIYNDQVLGSICVCDVCKQEDVIESKRIRALERQTKMNDIETYLSKSLQNCDPVSIKRDTFHVR